ncbi:hypothetical protein ABEB36_014197 [Hypothenemus hampei]|uniref:Reverse transcriptase zinc-binding domain-containing protein n=1 Tax=Hypothenemus hampei TaxID=57062 RepID=A0ABD1E3L0_HYPHA
MPMEAIQLIGTIIPNDLLGNETNVLCYLRNEEKKAKNDFIRLWQEIDSGQAIWSKEIVESVLDWINKKHDEEGTKCEYCDNPMDNAEHTVMNCEKWINEREELNNLLRKKLSVENATILC